MTITALGKTTIKTGQTLAKLSIMRKEALFCLFLIADLQTAVFKMFVYGTESNTIECFKFYIPSIRVGVARGCHSLKRLRTTALESSLEEEDMGSMFSCLLKAVLALMTVLCAQRRCVTVACFVAPL